MKVCLCPCLPTTQLHIRYSPYPAQNQDVMDRYSPTTPTPSPRPQTNLPLGSNPAALLVVPLVGLSSSVLTVESTPHSGTPAGRATRTLSYPSEPIPKFCSRCEMKRMQYESPYEEVGQAKQKGSGVRTHVVFFPKIELFPILVHLEFIFF
jgi:hypothetical protein